MTPNQNFVTAIISQAIEDARYTGTSVKYLIHKIHAVNWIMNKDEMLEWYCKLLDIDPDWVGDQIRQTNNLNITRSQQKSIRDEIKENSKNKKLIEVLPMIKENALMLEKLK